MQNGGKILCRKREKLLAELHNVLSLFWDKSPATELLKSKWKKCEITWLSAVVPLRAFVSTLLCSSNTIQGSPGKCSYEDVLLCKTETLFWTHIWILFCTPQRPTERCCVKCMHSIENVLQYSDTVVVILLLNSYLVVHDELNMKINGSLLSKSLLLFIDVFHTVPTFPFFFGMRKNNILLIIWKCDVEIICREANQLGPNTGNSWMTGHLGWKRQAIWDWERKIHHMNISANVINCCAHNDGIQTTTATCVFTYWNKQTNKNKKLTLKPLTWDGYLSVKTT